jgi:hypothetical protein
MRDEPIFVDLLTDPGDAWQSVINGQFVIYLLTTEKRLV